MAIFPLTLYRTYYRQGFFNVTVDYDQYVRKKEGPIILILSTSQQIQGRIDRRANLNATARIHGGAALRDWFQQHFECNDVVQVDLSRMDCIQMMK